MIGEHTLPEAVSRIHVSMSGVLGCLVFCLLVSCSRETTSARSFPHGIDVDSAIWADLPKWQVGRPKDICAATSVASGCRILQEPQHPFLLDSSLFVFDRRQGLLELTLRGDFVRQWGDIGSYPEGYAQVAAAGWTSGRQLMVWDPIYFQVTVYDSSGAVVRRVSLRSQGRAEWQGREELTNLRISARRFTFLTIPPARSSTPALVQGHFWRTSADFKPQRVLNVSAITWRRLNHDLQPPSPLFPSIEQWATTPDGAIWYVPVRRHLELEHYNSVGGPIGKTTVAVSARPTTSLETVAERDRRIHIFAPDLDIRLLASKCRAQNDIACSTYSFFDRSARMTLAYPILSGMVASDDNGIWIREYPYGPSDSVRWVHVAQGGQPDGSLRLAVDDSLEHAAASDLLVSNIRHGFKMQLLHISKSKR